MAKPQAVKVGSVATTPSEDQSPAQLYLAGQEDFVIPMIFPDYLIQVDGYESEVLGYKIKIPGQKAPYLGHAGVLIINAKSGLTKYYEYGRYPGPGPLGRTRSGRIPDISLKGGMIVESSLKQTLRVISKDHGQSGRISGVVLRGKVFEQALTWLEAKIAENNNLKRKEYELFTHNCMTFVADLVDHIGLESPYRPPAVVPSTYMEQFQFGRTDLEYDFANDSLEIFD
jgi:hypothetical protein